MYQYSISSENHSTVWYNHLIRQFGFIYFILLFFCFSNGNGVLVVMTIGYNPNTSLPER